MKIAYRYSDDQTVFWEKLDYQKSSGSGNTVRSDGLVTSQKWRHFGAAPEEAYNYSYDVPKRLTAGTYRHKPASSWISSGLYTENGIGYRVVLQEDPEIFTASAGFEPRSMKAESEQFIGYEEVTRIAADMLNHTEGEESTYAMRLRGVKRSN